MRKYTWKYKKFHDFQWGKWWYCNTSGLGYPICQTHQPSDRAWAADLGPGRPRASNWKTLCTWWEEGHFLKTQLSMKTCHESYSCTPFWSFVYVTFSMICGHFIGGIPPFSDKRISRQAQYWSPTTLLGLPSDASSFCAKECCAIVVAERRED